MIVQYYDELSGSLEQHLNSKEAKEKQLRQAIVNLEYENISNALNLTLEAHGSILSFYSALFRYIDATQDQSGGLELGETVLLYLEAYPTESLTGPLGVEFTIVSDDFVGRQRLLRQYQKALSLYLDNRSLDTEQKAKGSTSIYHQLGRVAQVQRQWARAPDFFLKA